LGFITQGRRYVEKMRPNIKYIMSIAGGLVGLFLLITIIWNIYQPTKEDTITAPSQPEKLEQPASSTTPNRVSIATSGQSSGSESVNQQEVEQMIRYLEKLDKEEGDGPADSPVIANQQLSVMERLKAFRQSSKEYQALREQASTLRRQFNQSWEPILEVEYTISDVLHEFVKIPHISTEEAQRARERLERNKDQMSPEEYQKVLEILSRAKGRQDEVHKLSTELKSLNEIHEALKEEQERIHSQLREVYQAIIGLYHQHGLPGTHAELEAARQQERRSFQDN
jgi:hypothetical protein